MNATIINLYLEVEGKDTSKQESFLNICKDNKNVNTNSVSYVDLSISPLEFNDEDDLIDKIDEALDHHQSNATDNIFNGVDVAYFKPWCKIGYHTQKCYILNKSDLLRHKFKDWPPMAVTSSFVTKNQNAAYATTTIIYFDNEEAINTEIRNILNAPFAPLTYPLKWLNKGAKPQSGLTHDMSDLNQFINHTFNPLCDILTKNGAKGKYNACDIIKALNISINIEEDEPATTDAMLARLFNKL